MTSAKLILNGWEVYAHPLFLGQLEGMIAAVEAARKRDPESYKSTRAAKVLAATLKVAFDVLPRDPARAEYRQGHTLGDAYKHWFRVSYLQQYRLFFRYRATASSNILLLVWVNDEATLRAYGSRRDAYATFRKMLKRNNPPDNWDALMQAATSGSVAGRLSRVVGNQST